MAAKQATRRPGYALVIEKLLAEAGWRDENLAAAAGVSTQTVSLARLGRRKGLRHATATAIAAAFSKQLRRAISAEDCGSERARA